MPPYNRRRNLLADVTPMFYFGPRYPLHPQVPLFKDCEEAFIRHLVMRLRLQVYLEGEIVFRMGDVGHEMYFITKVRAR